MKLGEFYRFIIWEYKFIWLVFVIGFGILIRSEWRGYDV